MKKKFAGDFEFQERRIPQFGFWIENFILKNKILALIDAGL